ncbi:aminotransferase class IV [Flavihumibacter petaseus]|uniref:branched-chain-amino-acid transaminase n=1 Tax=Flavihumibacter petaseus NBRC 106054 TaxID=1220578 RepID=A0A0E9N6J9_9BACT|nr:aminotransferase class IV [Flavihumibacter petaseus]GAO45572.1 putative aminotransferase [Flavihumibacter petaseus NBRC 106054]
MSHLLFHDGQFYRDDKVIAGANSRALRYGDGLFETMVWRFGTIPLFQFHVERLFHGMQLLGFEKPVDWNDAWIAERIRQLVHRNGHEPLARIRLMILRGDGSPFDHRNNYPHLIMQSWSLPQHTREWQQEGLKTGLHETARKAIDGIANCKTNNYLPSLLAAREAASRHWDDALLLNTAGRICESSIANCFVFMENKWLTPPLGEGPVAGTVRRHILETAETNGVPVEEKPLNAGDLFNADAMVLTNAVQGLRWVSSFGKKHFSNEPSKILFDALVRPLMV